MNALRILVADDEAGMRHGVMRALRGLSVRLPDVDATVGVEVEEVASGEEALARVDVQPPDILLLDHKMTGMSGLDVLHALQQRGSEFLTIMVTAFATIESAVQATKCGAFDFIAKPFTPDELRGVIRKAAEHLTAQRRARELAEENRRVRFDFIRVLGHELKTPLAAIENYLYLLRDRTAGEYVEAYERPIQRCLCRAQGMRKLIADLLDLTRIESGQRQRTFEAVDVAEIAREALELVAPVAEARGIALALAADGPVVLRCDRAELEIVLNNLVSNAVKYNRDGGRVDVAVQRDDPYVRIVVRDTGIGMSAEESARLFQDFVRIRNEKTREITGSGLGLAIVKKIAGLYGGDVAVASTPDAGTTFTVTLKPAGEAQADDAFARDDQSLAV